MFSATLCLCRNFFARTHLGGITGGNVKRPYRIDYRMDHDKKRRMKRRLVSSRRMMKS